MPASLHPTHTHTHTKKHRIKEILEYMKVQYTQKLRCSVFCNKHPLKCNFVCRMRRKEGEWGGEERGKTAEKRGPDKSMWGIHKGKWAWGWKWTWRESSRGERLVNAGWGVRVRWNDRWQVQMEKGKKIKRMERRRESELGGAALKNRECVTSVAAVAATFLAEQISWPEEKDKHWRGNHV